MEEDDFFLAFSCLEAAFAAVADKSWFSEAFEPIDRDVIARAEKFSLRVRENGILQKVLINSNIKRNVTNRFSKQEEVPLFLKSMTRQAQLLWKICKDPNSDQYRSSFSLNFITDLLSIIKG